MPHFFFIIVCNILLFFLSLLCLLLCFSLCQSFLLTSALWENTVSSLFPKNMHMHWYCFVWHDRGNHVISLYTMLSPLTRRSCFVLQIFYSQSTFIQNLPSSPPYIPESPHTNNPTSLLSELRLQVICDLFWGVTDFWRFLRLFAEKSSQISSRLNDIWLKEFFPFQFGSCERERESW